MAEIYRYTDGGDDEEDARIVVHSQRSTDLIVEVFPIGDPGLGISIDIPDEDGRRLLAALQRYYKLPLTSGTH